MKFVELSTGFIKYFRAYRPILYYIIILYHNENVTAVQF